MTTPESLRELLERVRSGDLAIADAARRLSELPFAETAEATIDHHRTLRCGIPEVIYGEGKSPAQVLSIAERLASTGAVVLATRLRPEAAEALVARFPDGRLTAEARFFHIPGTAALPRAAPVAVISAGTSDQPVSEEAAATAEALGAPVVRVRDVGVAGLHRLLAHQSTLRDAAALVVVAGMEGALPSVVGGLTDRPVIAVPTSVGYGANLGGITPLLAMLNSCASGVAVVNIDNGFGAAVTAVLIARLAAAAGGAPAA